MQIEVIKNGGLRCLCCHNDVSDKIVYILYPLDDMDEWLSNAADRYGVSIVCISGMNWDGDLTPWPAPGVPKGDPDFEGLGPQFLDRLTGSVIPEIESSLGITGGRERTLIGISLSGLFALWQWPQSDFFRNIATLSGSYWYDGFVDWVERQAFSGKRGVCYMLLGEDEPKARNYVFRRVGRCTEEIVGYMRRQGVDVTYNIVPGNHYQHTLERLDRALHHIFRHKQP